MNQKLQLFQSFLAILPLIKGKIRDYLNRSFEREIFLGLGVILAIFLFVASFLGYNLNVKNLKANIAEKLPCQNLFAQSPKNFTRESPEMSFIQKNSLKGVSSPETITSQTMGMLLGSVESESEQRKEVLEYTVKPGETLSAIAENFGISLNTILWANDLSSISLIKPGQKLIILPVSGVFYTIQKGDTLSQLAKTLKGNIEEIIAFNELSSEGDIFIGDILIIPDGQLPKRIPQIALTPLAESYFIFPCEGKISQGLHFSNAVDIANNCNKPVVAAASGTIQRAGRVWAGGNRITILHSNGVVTYYGHLSAILVQAGQAVRAGDIIGYIGNTGYTLGTTGCHLHFEVRGANNFLAKYSVGTNLSWAK